MPLPSSPTHRPTDTPVASPTGTSTPLPTTTPTPSETPLPNIETFSIGNSVEGRPILATRYGLGPNSIILAGAIHGFEKNTARLVEELQIGLDGQVPDGWRIYLIPILNPDGYANGTRWNANFVDLNRNWDTPNWSRDTCYDQAQLIPGGGGTQPFSEPETIAFSTWLLSLAAMTGSPPMVISYHAYHEGGLVLPGYLATGAAWITYPPAAEFGMRYASASGYPYSETWPYCPMTGELSNWCAENGIPCLLVELHADQVLTQPEILLHQQAILESTKP